MLPFRRLLSHQLIILKIAFKNWEDSSIWPISLYEQYFGVTKLLLGKTFSLKSNSR